jgi:hypothetical protein
LVLFSAVLTSVFTSSLVWLFLQEVQS